MIPTLVLQLRYVTPDGNLSEPIAARELYPDREVLARMTLRIETYTGAVDEPFIFYARTHLIDWNFRINDDSLLGAIGSPGLTERRLERLAQQLDRFASWLEGKGS